MSQPRYQIFVSSTFKDLQEEREAVLKAILKLNQFPAGMEIFPAVDDTPWEHIEKVIEVSDYYVLIIGGKYGSIEAESGISYTEKEYDFAVSKNIPVLAFTHSDEEKIPFGKTEKSEEIREKLKLFKQKVGDRHHWNRWNTLEELKANVVTSLAMAFATNPQKGWTKAGGIETTELLERLAELQNRYDKLQIEHEKLSKLKNKNIENFAQGEDLIEVKLKPKNSNDDVIKIQISWNQIFFELAKELITKKFEHSVKSDLFNLVIQLFDNDTKKTTSNPISKNNYNLDDSDFKLVKNQLLALDLIKIHEERSNSKLMIPRPTDFVWYWQLTEKGKNLYLNNIALRKKKILE